MYRTSNIEPTKKKEIRNYRRQTAKRPIGQLTCAASVASPQMQKLITGEPMITTLRNG